MPEPKTAQRVTTHIAMQPSELDRYFNRRIAPFLWLLFFLIIGGLTLAVFNPLPMICGIILFLKGFLHFTVRHFRDTYYRYEHFIFDDDSVTFSTPPNRYRRSTWSYRIRFHDIAQIRWKKGALNFIFNDANTFKLPETAEILPGSSGEGYSDLLHTIHRSFVDRVSYHIPFQDPFKKAGGPKDELLRDNMIVLAMKGNFDEINRKVLWEGISKNNRGSVEGIFGLIMALSFVFTFIWGMVLAVTALGWVYYLILKGSIEEANAELDHFSGMQVHVLIFGVMLVIFLTSYGIWKLNRLKMDRKYGTIVNKHYWYEYQSPKQMTIIENGITVGAEDTPKVLEITYRTVEDEAGIHVAREEKREIVVGNKLEWKRR